jgi:hypothetical protein
MEACIDIVVAAFKFGSVGRDAQMLSNTARVEELFDLADSRVAQILCHVGARLADVVLQTGSAVVQNTQRRRTYRVPLGPHVR